ncbi:13374_t:CDS:2 [Entrophospora sp. SA101]|nr:13374_t:CDS:2 [Entrophospora sp. SA101]
MESKFAHKRVIEPKYMRKKVVFVDPDDPSASYWWPALDNYNNNIQASTKTVICKHNQAGVDLVLPVLLDWDGSNTISLDSMSYFQIQIKNWNQFHDDYDWTASATSDTGIINVEDNIFSEISTFKHVRNDSTTNQSTLNHYLGRPLQPSEQQIFEMLLLRMTVSIG